MRPLESPLLAWTAVQVLQATRAPYAPASTVFVGHQGSNQLQVLINKVYLKGQIENDSKLLMCIFDAYTI